MGGKSFLGEFEQMVLLAVLQLKEEAHAPDVAAELERSAQRTVSRGALYSALDRLEKKGMVRWSIEAADSERGGYPKRRFEVTDAGMEMLKDSRAALLNLWAGLEKDLARD
ncbi:MAG: helix-turn-helix transcriptional regulator [Acidobacteriota bacterium]|jgi:DNA-binding PadR family transcriptional regulator